MTLVKAAALGAGIVGTAATDAVWFRRYRAGGGKQPAMAWETADGTADYDKAAAPAQVGRKLYGAVLRRQPPADSARLMTNVMHWGTGLQWAALYGVAASRTRHPLVAATAFGPSVWAFSYVALPLLDVYTPMWEYDAKTLWLDFTAHLAYGAATTLTFAALPADRRHK